MFSYLFKKYNVPLKGGRAKEMWTINWPWLYREKVKSDTEKRSSTSIFLDALLECIKDKDGQKIPPGAEDKFTNTEKYLASSLADLDANKG